MSLRSIQRPERWSVPFSDEMDAALVAKLLTQPPFENVDPANFRGKITPDGILQNDAKITEYEPGEIIVRAGDWGNSAFFVLEGQLRADLESSGGSNNAILGKEKRKRKNVFQLFAQLWGGSSETEVRDIASYAGPAELKKRGKGNKTRIFLPDLAAVLDDHRTAIIEHGQFFGELSALGRTPRQATVVAETKAMLLEIRWQGLRDLMRGDQSIKNHIDNVFRERALKWFLLNTPLFSHLDDQQTERLVEAAEFETFGQYDWATSFKNLATKRSSIPGSPDNDHLEQEPLISKQGDHPNGVIIIRSGLARLTRDFENGQQTVGYLGPGQIYGMDEISSGWQSNEPIALKHSLRAIGITTVVVIPTPIVEELLLDSTKGRKPNTREIEKSNPSHFQRIHTDFIEFLVEDRFVNGTQTMLIDMDRCTRCDECVKACAETHDNNPRFLRDGPIQNNVMVASACMHCADPVCMIECPTGAIHREISDGTVVINDQTCIGCSSCANNCPYGAIRMVEVRHSDGKFIRDQGTQLPIVKATKCDLCVDQLGGPACQRACPHGAMVRMDMQDIKSLADWMQD